MIYFNNKLYYSNKIYFAKYKLLHQILIIYYINYI